ncbi:MAG TPA: GIY-YIG nuclease family protein [Nitrospirae bacterium]|nr:GIY-YIG nuclease family protein [Nitrospirota bacterium]
MRTELVEVWYLYILKCNDGSLYTGTTPNLQRRIKSHNDGSGGRYTRCRLPVSLIYSESYSIKSDALKRELQIKGWSRAKKESLIAGNLAKLQQLSKNK